MEKWPEPPDRIGHSKHAIPFKVQKLMLLLQTMCSRQILIVYLIGLSYFTVFSNPEPECERYVHEGDFEHFLEIFSDPSPEAEIMDWLFFTEYGVPLNRGHIDGFEASRPKILPLYHQNRPYGVVRVTENKVVLLKKDLQKLVLHLKVPFSDKAFVFKTYVFISPSHYINLFELEEHHQVIYNGPRSDNYDNISGLDDLLQEYYPDFPDPMLTADTRDTMSKECFHGDFYCVIDQVTGELKGSYNQIYYSGHDISIFQWNEFYGGQYIVDHVTGHCFRINRKTRTFKGPEPQTISNMSFPEMLTKYPFVMSDDVFLTRRFMLIDEEIDNLNQDFDNEKGTVADDEVTTVTEYTTVTDEELTTEPETERTTEPQADVATSFQTFTVHTTTESTVTQKVERWHDTVETYYGDGSSENDQTENREYDYDKPVEDTVPTMMIPEARPTIKNINSPYNESTRPAPL
ncbi:unnamed protein product [Bursaphelenchus okinawaensis]|uniref:Uncharacterized protein n=1 Tax=Bursaphelenchus okinawaensis TaxID=465554 RepID=A0A811JWD1_9BILA|nr:unnamed protein product [Bursaphelenchus okinawaensis]CAG9086702.1 unnamed protein product [Bursaphelenchus okinawaensis]